MTLTRKDYKAIKHMDKRTLDNYLLDVYIDGYRAGVQAMADGMKKQASESGGEKPS